MKYPYKVITGYTWGVTDSTGNGYQVIRKWLSNNIGQEYEFWQILLGDDKLAVDFVDKKHAVYFALKWA